ncbi:seryl-tRNA synthetase [Theileria orientalis]|uniref:serine--tRNA ligase n=1 Tax=Theileria orientalis TaxID=68886 RepID=A0A976M7D0_THEOR|nr:seryl-tRNA synthetase [Theileria orientalis]
MVLDINYFRDENLLKELRESEARRCETNSVVDRVIEADNDWKKAMYSYEQLKRNLNEMSKKISEYAKLNRGKGDLNNDTEFLNLKTQAEIKKEGIAECLKNIEECNNKRNNLLKMVGNIVATDLVASKDESLNDVIRSWVPSYFPWEGSKFTCNSLNNTNNADLNNTAAELSGLDISATSNATTGTTANSTVNTSSTAGSNGAEGTTPKSGSVDKGVYYERKHMVGIKTPPWKILQHHEILTRLNGLEVTKGVEIAGHRGFFLKGAGCLLNLALIQYGFNFLVRKGFHPMHTPYLMRKEIMSECAELDDFEETLYCIPPLNGPSEGENAAKDKDFDKNKLFLIATSEQPLAALHRNETYQRRQLPLKYAGLSTCFRREAGAHGRDLKGIFRVHQFQKVEQFVVCSPESSKEMHEHMLSLSEEFYRSLKLPFRVVSIVAGALNKAASKKYDLEAWFPGYNDYRELVSCSNCTDYQARNLNSKYYDKNNQERTYLHMLNGTLVASQRCLCCILENYQTPDGVIVPAPLVPYMDGQEFIPYEQ